MPKFLTNIDLTKNELQNALIHKNAGDPSGPIEGQLYFDTTAGQKRAKIYTTAWETVPTIGAGTPTTLTAATTNAAGSSVSGARLDHTHAITVSNTSTPTASAIAAYDAGGKLYSTLPVGGDAATVVATKGYVDALAQGLDVHASVRTATIQVLTSDGTGYTYTPAGGTSARGQITWSTGPTAIDGVTLANADRILVKNEATGANGIWVRTSQNTWDRATDWDYDADVSAGAFMFVEEGTVNADTGWVLSTNGVLVIGGASGTVLAFTQFSSAGVVLGGNGLVKTGNTLDIVSHAGSAGTIGTINIGVDAIGVNLGTTSTTAAAGDHSHANMALTTGTLAQFAATTSLQLLGVISDETGSGSLVFATTPTFTTSVLGGASFDAWNTITTTLNIGGAATSLSIGNVATAAQTVNMFTASIGASTYNFASGATSTATTKTVNFGTGGAAGSTTNINIGSAVAGTTTVNSNTMNIGNAATISIGTTVAAPTTVNFMTGLTNAGAKTLNIGTGSTGGALTTVLGGSIRLAGHASAGHVVTDASGNVSISTNVSHTYATSIGNGALTSIVVTHSLGTKDVQIYVYDNTTPFAQVYPDVQNTDTTTCTIVFASAPTTNQYRVVVVG